MSKKPPEDAPAVDGGEAVLIGKTLAAELRAHCLFNYAIMADTLVAALAAAPAPAVGREAVDLREAAKEFFNATIADPTVRVRCQTPEKRDAVHAASKRLESILRAAPPAEAREPVGDADVIGCNLFAAVRNEMLARNCTPAEADVIAKAIVARYRIAQPQATPREPEDAP